MISISETGLCLNPCYSRTLYIIFSIAKDVEALVCINNKEMSSKDDDGNQSTVKIEEFEIKIRSSVLSMDQLRALITAWLNEYQEYKAPNKHLRFFLYR